MAGPENIGGGTTSPECTGELLGKQGGAAACLGKLMESLHVFPGWDDESRQTTIEAVRGSGMVTAETATGFQLACNDACSANCELVMPQKPGDWMSMEPLGSSSQLPRNACIDRRES